VIDPWGRVPQPYVDGGKLVYSAAYQQILKGYPAVDYSVRDIIYRPRNLRVNRVYGMSPVEQIITTVNIALRRQLYLLDYFLEGNVPDSLIGVPENWTPDQISSYQKYWDAYFDGDLGRRRRAKFVPGGVAKTFIQTKEPELKGAFDDWLARIVCFAFSISPQALTQTVNRATAETQKELAEEEGLGPILGWAKSLIDDILASEFDAPDLEFIWGPGLETDPATQEAILSSYATKGILTINEARAALGARRQHL
jgi:phage portal protein BeeE